MFNTRLKFVSLATFILLIAAVSAACNLPFQMLSAAQTPEAPATASAPEEPQPSATVAPLADETSTPLPTATEAPTATEEMESGAAVPGWPVAASAEGFGFSYPPSLANGVSFEMTPAQDPAEPGATGWLGGVPETPTFHFDGYVLPDTFHTPIVSIYPLKLYKEIDPETAHVEEELSALLATRPETMPESIPFLPFWNAAQVMRAAPQYLDFSQGSGVRFLTKYAQGPGPMDNEGLFYTFQGLSSDGEWYISVILPIHLPALDSKENLDKFSYDKLTDGSLDFMTYVEEMSRVIDGAAPEAFTPNLNELDAMMRSITLP